MRAAEPFNLDGDVAGEAGHANHKAAVFALLSPEADEDT